MLRFADMGGLDHVRFAGVSQATARSCVGVTRIKANLLSCDRYRCSEESGSLAGQKLLNPSHVFDACWEFSYLLDTWLLYGASR